MECPECGKNLKVNNYGRLEAHYNDDGYFCSGSDARVSDEGLVKLRWSENFAKSKTDECKCGLCSKKIDEYFPIRITDQATNLKVTLHQKCYFDNVHKLDLVP